MKKLNAVFPILSCSPFLDMRAGGTMKRGNIKNCRYFYIKYIYLTDLARVCIKTSSASSIHIRNAKSSTGN